MRVAIIGGGAGGMMCAVTILERNPNIELYLIEKNSILGSKVLISGGGRCNLTTGIRDLSVLLKKYPRGSRFLRYALHNFSPEKVYNWFENNGVPLKIEKDLRVFPKSNNGKDVVGVFERKLRKNNSEVIFKASVNKILENKKNGKNKFSIYFENNRHGVLEVDKVVLATGGQAYRHTGSTGDGYDFAIGLGHTITSLAPSLSSFVLKEEWIRKLSGVSFEQVGLTVNSKNKYLFDGPIVITHRGISGPAVFAMSSLCAFEKISKDTPLSLFIDFVPYIDETSLLSDIKNYISNNPNKTFITNLHRFIPKSVCESIISMLDIDISSKNSNISKKVLNKSVQLLKNHNFNIVGRGGGDEFVTAGGVELSEIDQKTMESKITKGLYFAGEIMNIDAFTGGFNLQSSWATGRLAGESIGML